MSNQIHIIQNAITTTISEIFRGDFRRICEVKKAVLHLEAIYFCHGTCYLLKRENMPIKDQLALYQRIELIPQSTTEFFENNRECIINNWPEESALAAKPEILYDALLASEFCVQPERVGYKIDKVSRDIAGAYYTSSDGCHRLIHEKTGFTAWDRYYWNLVPNSRNLFDKVAAIKDEHLWDEVIDEYLEKKNMYLRRQDYNHPSFNVYVETVNQVFNKYFD